MRLLAWASSTSVPQGAALDVQLADAGGRRPRGTVHVCDAATGTRMLEDAFDGPVWTLTVPLTWPSALYRLRFSPGEADVYVVVRATRPGASSPVLVSLPFLTWQAYNQIGVPGECLYETEQPERAARVSFDRPGGGPVGDWEGRFLRWFAEAGPPVEFCSGIDLHQDRPLLGHYRLLVTIGHDEYWTREMRDNVETFIDTGGNVAFFGGNTCWWQARLEDGGRTLVCYRDALADPVAATDPGRATVEWSAAPVNRPENTLTGLSYRLGAACWEDMSAMADEAYTARFADHWVFAGTGLRDGDLFARGAIGYETDAAETEQMRGVPRITGRDGSPASLVVLATADLQHWRSLGQGGAATMGVFRRGAGTVFNAASVGWGNALDDPVVDRITRNVLDRLARPDCARRWEVIGRCDGISAVAAFDDELWGASRDGLLRRREWCGQNLSWVDAGRMPDAVALAAPRQAIAGFPVALHALTSGGSILRRDPEAWPDREGACAAAGRRAEWTEVGRAPDGAVALAMVYESAFVATDDGALWALPLSLLGDPTGWIRVGAAGDAGGGSAVALANLFGRLCAVDASGLVSTRPPVLCAAPWTPLGSAPAGGVLAAHAGWLVVGDPDGLLWWREALPPPVESRAGADRRSGRLKEEG